MATISSPLPGFFYRRPARDQDEYVREGDVIAEGQTIGLVGVMKSCTELKATQAGTLIEFLVEDEEEVSVGQGVASWACSYAVRVSWWPTGARSPCGSSVPRIGRGGKPWLSTPTRTRKPGGWRLPMLRSISAHQQHRSRIWTPSPWSKR